MGNKPILLFLGLLVAGLVFVTYLGRSVIQDLDALSTARHDNFSWNLSQLEVETLKLDGAAHDAIHGHEADLGAFRTQFDIYFSRVSVLTQSQSYDLIRDNPDAQTAMTAATAFLDNATPIVDGPDSDLRAALPALQTEIHSLRPRVRALALAGIQVFAEVDAARRAELSQTLIKLAASVIGLILILTLGLVALVKLHRRGHEVARENQAAHSRFAAAVSSSLDAVLVVDTSGHIIEFNGAAETVFGYTRSEALGANMGELIVPEHLREMHHKGMTRFLETGERRVIDAGRVRLEGLRKSGEIFPVELSISLSEADGERVFVSFLRDITKELEAEEALRTARDKAQESEKAKSDLLTVMSHEMRTPLNGILGSLALIDRDSLDARQNRHLNSISVSGELLLSHVNDVLDLSSLASDSLPHKRGHFDLRDMVQQMADSQMANAQAQGNTLTVEFLTESLGMVLGVKRALQQCLINLVGNAIKFTRDGSVAIEVERLNGRDQVEIRISDTGVGIAPENLDRIFEEFVTIDTAYSRRNAGTGLGLAITKRLVEAMEGDIDADSLPGEGSLFTIRLPLPVTDADSGDRDQSQRDNGTPIATGQKALVVDDNEINRMILVEMLRKSGLRVEEAEDGFAALEQVAQNPFDILFLDISMPGIDGIETLHRIRALDVAWRNIPALAVTAHAASKDHDVILQAPFADLLVKPVRPDAIRDALATALPETDRQARPPATAGGDFREQFGEERYQAALSGFRTELAALAKALNQSTELSDDLRRTAHKLCGSAAVLGEPALHARLQEIEHHNAPDWPVDKARHIQALHAFLNA